MYLLLAVFTRSDAARKAYDGLHLLPGLAQLWCGGRVDRATRTISRDPAHWLVCADLSLPIVQDVAAADASAWWHLEQVFPGNAASPDGAGAIAFTATDIAPEVEEEFNAWYSSEHMPRLAATPGVLRARRFRAIRAASRYVAVYHLESPDAYHCQQWQSANETPWTRRMRSRFLHPQSFVFDQRVALTGFASGSR